MRNKMLIDQLQDVEKWIDGEGFQRSEGNVSHQLGYPLKPQIYTPPEHQQPNVVAASYFIASG
jgi:hypothetical protein